MRHGAVDLNLAGFFKKEQNVHLLRSMVLSPIAWLCIGTAAAQLPNATDTTATPAPGAHDYISSLAETVNPANGSVSIQIPVHIARSRGLTVPFSIAYGSGAEFSIVSTGGGPAYAAAWSGIGFMGGWSYTYPLLSLAIGKWTIPSGNDGNITCYGSYNYVFQDLSGDRHNLGLAVSANVASPDGYDNCNEGFDQDGEYPTGGEGSILATTSIPSQNHNYAPPTFVYDADGTGYSFYGTANGLQPGTTHAATITDRNGNTVTVTSSAGTYPSIPVTYTDTIGRTALSVSGLGGNPDTITVAGLSTSYKVYWTTASANFSLTMTNLQQGLNSCPTRSSSATAKVVSQIVMPNSGSYTFIYDSPYGMISKITYPGGGYVRYVWGLNSQSEAGSFSWSSTDPNPWGGYPISEGWECRYDYPAITDRYVSSDGTNEVLHQHFAYSTTWPNNTSETWTSKTTTVTTYDLARNPTPSYVTTYTYSPLPSPYVPGCPSCDYTAQVPVESTIQYNDTGGALLQTVTKNWQNVRLVQSIQTALSNGQSSLDVFCYNNWEQLSEKDEYDLGAGTPSSPCTSVPSGTASGGLLRKTKTQYATFSSHIVDKPASTIAYDGSGTRLAETDFSSYDANGNLLMKTAQCFDLPGGSSCPQGNSTVSFQYDGNGQVTSATDANSNPATTYSYTDSYSPCNGTAPPTSPSDAYLTQVKYPTVNGITQTINYCYDYASGLLLSATDQNTQITKYQYNDPLDRLKQVSYPDNGLTSYNYTDISPSPYYTSTTSLNSSQSASTETIMNGLGAVTERELTSDPGGAMILGHTVLDGLGRPYQVYNPYRSPKDPTYGYDTYVYDALGRTTSVTHYPDSTSRSVLYSGNCSTATDEAGRSRKTCVDGLGRNTYVYEDPSGLNLETDYTYDALNNLTKVEQWGGPSGSPSPRIRTFAFDSLTHLVSATNPESGTTSYNYDPNGNVTSRTDGRNITTTYSYDLLNRMTKKSYLSNDPGKTPITCFQYDVSSVNGAAGNLKGRLTNEWTQPYSSSSCAAPPSGSYLTLRSVLSYDPMGRITGEQQCTPNNCIADSGPTLSYAYDLAGDLTSKSNSVGANGSPLVLTDGFDSAGRLNSITSSWTAFPTGLFNVPSSGYGPAGLLNWTLGPNLSVTQSYTNRLWLNSIVAAGQIP